MNVFRRRVFDVADRIKPLDVLFSKNDGSQLSIYSYDNWPDSGWVPIGIVVVPASHNRYLNGKAGIMSLYSINSDGVRTSINDSGVGGGVDWDNRSTPVDTSLVNYLTVDGTNTECTVFYLEENGNIKATGDSTYPFVYYPYSNITLTTVRTLSDCALGDCDGYTNTQILNDGNHPVADYCLLYNTTGTQTGDWYCPAIGELAYIPILFYSINKTILLLNAKYGAVGKTIHLTPSYYSSTERSSTACWVLDSNKTICYVSKYRDRRDVQLVRAFIQY